MGRRYGSCRPRSSTTASPTSPAPAHATTCSYTRTMPAGSGQHSIAPPTRPQPSNNDGDTCASGKGTRPSRPGARADGKPLVEAGASAARYRARPMIVLKMRPQPAPASRQLLPFSVYRTSSGSRDDFGQLRRCTAAGDVILKTIACAAGCRAHSVADSAHISRNQCGSYCRILSVSTRKSFSLAMVNGLH
jgi:hypothetical protein